MQQRLVQFIEADIRQQTGKVYRIDWDKLDLAELREVKRMLDDFRYEKQVIVNRARREPWRIR